MNNTVKNICLKVKNGIVYGFITGFCIGCFPNKINICFNNKKYNNIPLPLLFGVIGSTSVVISAT